MIIKMALRGLIAGAALTWGAMSAQALTVEQGETYSLSFDNLSFIGSGNVGTSAKINLSPDNIFGPDETILLRYFENVDFTGNILDFTLSTNNIFTFPTVGNAFFDGTTWTDLNGSLSITMIIGSISIGNIVVEVSNTSGIYRETFQPSAVVPAPVVGAGLPALLALGGFVWARRRKASATAA